MKGFNLNCFRKFSEVVQNYMLDATPGKHFGAILQATPLAEEGKRGPEFSAAEAAGLFLAHLTILERGMISGMVTDLDYDGNNLKVIIYDPKLTTLDIPLAQLRSFAIMQQPRDGTQFVIRNGTLIKIDCNEPIKPEGIRHGTRATHPPYDCFSALPMEH